MEQYLLLGYFRHATRFLHRFCRIVRPRQILHAIPVIVHDFILHKHGCTPDEQFGTQRDDCGKEERMIAILAGQASLSVRQIMPVCRQADHACLSSREYAGRSIGE